MARKKSEVNKIRGENLRKLLSYYGMDQKDLAQKIGYTKEHISYIVNGRRNLTLDAAENIVKIFPGVHLDWLMGHGGFMNDEEENASRAERNTLLKDSVNGIWQTNRGKASGEVGVVVGGNIKRYRAKRNMTAERLSEATGIPVDKIYAYEENADAATTKDLDMISKALKLKTATLYGQLPAPADITQWTVQFSNGDSVGGHISFVVGQIMGKLNSDGHEAALCMLHGLLENPRYQNKEETLDGQKEGEQ